MTIPCTVNKTLTMGAFLMTLYTTLIPMKQICLVLKITQVSMRGVN